MTDMGENSNIVLTAGMVVTFLTVVVNLVYTWLKDGREQRWKEAELIRQAEAVKVAKEDAEKIAADLKVKAAEIADKIASKLALEALKVADESTERSKVLASTVTENITASAALIKASNAVNEKIAYLMKQLISIKRARQVQPGKRSRK